MDFDIASQASAIDDTFLPFTTIPASNSSNSGRFSSHAPISGPRSGHWTVTTGGNRSGIDDRTPTLPGRYASSAAESLAPVRRVDTSALPFALRKLAIATEAERKAKLEAQRVAEQKVVEESAGQMNKEEKVKGFYLPPVQDGRGIRIRSRNGKDEIVKDPVFKSIILPAPAPKKVASEKPATEIARPPSPAKSVKSAAAASNASRRTANRVRIVGKNGEEAFIELPFLPSNTRPASLAQPHKQAPQAALASPKPPAASAPKAPEDAEDKSKRNEAAEKEAKRLREERLAAEAKRIHDEQVAAEAKRMREERAAAEAKRAREGKAAAEAKKLETEKLAAEAMMQGALPVSSRAASVAKSARGSKSSSRVSAKQFPAVFDPVSKAASVASSTTSISRALSVQQQQSQVSGVVHQPASARSRPPTATGWQEVGFGTYEAVDSNNGGSRQSKPLMPVQSRQASMSPRGQVMNSPKGGITAGTPQHSSPISNPTPSQRSPHPTSLVQRPASKASQQPPPHRSQPSQPASMASSVTTDSFPIEFPPLSNHSHQQPQRQPSRGSEPRQEGPTVFAGRGWISPHPLSEPPTWAREEPDPLIQLPRGASVRSRVAHRASSGVETMTYEEWLRVQNETASHLSGSKAHAERQSTHARSHQINETYVGDDERRNISRTSSHASHHRGGGSWGYRNAGPRTEASGNYRPPTVKTESEEGRWQQQGSLRRSNGRRVVADRFVDDNGNTKTQLNMPWDGRSARDEKASEGSGDKFF